MKSPYMILLSLVVAVACGSCSRGPAYRHCDGAVWSTTYHITYASDVMLDDSILDVMRRVEMSLSPFADSSLVSAINRGDTDQTDALFERIFSTSQMVCRASGGAFDPTVMPLVELWGFGRNRNVAEPSRSSIDSALVNVGMMKNRISGGRIYKATPATTFDFSSITKGYGCDLVGEMLERNGCTDYMVEIGGEMALKGSNPRGAKWRVMIEAPVDNDSVMSRDRMSVVELSDCGVATSGNYRNYHDFASGRKGHTISPVTGYPVETSTLSATVVAPDAMTADAFATACMTMPEEAALAMIESIPGVEALIVTVGSDGRWQLKTTSAFPNLQ